MNSIPLDDHTDGSTDTLTPVQFGGELKRALRHGDARRTKIGALARQVGVSQSTLYAYLAGTTLPSAEVLDDLLHVLGASAEDQRRLSTVRDSLDEERRLLRPHDHTDRPVPRELPPDLGETYGRADLFDQLDATLDSVEASRPAVVALSGPVDAGKTSLAVRWARRHRLRFIDGSLYADLRGSSDREPRNPTDVLGEFLRSLGVTDKEVPASAPERARRFRTTLADRRMVVLLDNALDADQVRPLLPGEGRIVVLVTSTNPLPELQINPGAVLIPVRR